MTDEDLEQQEQKEDNNEAKEEKKSLTRRIISIVIIIDLFVAIILLLLFGLNKCSKGNDNISSSSSSNEPYNGAPLNSVFCNIVKEYDSYMGYDDLPSSIISIAYKDNRITNNKFDLSISAVTNNKLLCYDISNISYPENYESDLLTYLLSLDDYFLESESSTTHFYRYDLVDEVITTSKSNNHYKIGQDGTIKRLSGFYVDDNNNYHSYYRKEITSGDPFLEQEDMVITKDDIFYDYFAYLSK